MMIDLRSDTITRPTEEMRKVMSAAEVGDDVYGEDPTVRRLEELAAGLTGHEAALFVTSGTQGNLVALLSHCARGDGAIVGKECHIYNYEGGGLAVLGGVMPLVVDDTGGLPSTECVRALCRDENVHFAPARLLCLENTHNREGGNAVDSVAYGELVRCAIDAGLAVHLDGARVFNAAVAWKVNVKEFTAAVDSVQLCLSKGLGAPVGSVVCGSKEFIRQARHWRKRLGGGLRQAGVIASAGIVALERMVSRLAEDHGNAALLATLLREGGMDVESCAKPTNMVYVSLSPSLPGAKEIAERCGKRGVVFNPTSPRRFRLVTHFDVDEADVRKAAAVILEEARPS